MGLAQRLNLHAPFRSFGNGNGFDDLNPGLTDRARKRHRSPSSITSYLEPARLPVAPLNDKMDRKAASRRNRHHRNDDTTSKLSSQHSRSSSETFVSPEKPVKTYEKRSRHKTKEDHYELKQNKVALKQRKKQNDRKDDDAKKNKKSKLHQKSGATLVPKFAAQSVAPDRLTVAFSPSGLPSEPPYLS